MVHVQTHEAFRKGGRHNKSCIREHLAGKQQRGAGGAESCSEKTNSRGDNFTVDARLFPA